MKRTALIAFLFVIFIGAVALYFAYRSPHSGERPDLISLVSTDDHILGNPAAPLVFVEYCDIDSTYCKNFQTVMESVVATYGKSGKVAWVYRHLPLTEQYSNAEFVAEAAECAGTDDLFFKFIDAVYATPANAGALSVSDFAGLAHQLGIDTNEFTTCMNQHRYEDRVMGEAQNARAAGATGVPYTILLVNGKATPSIEGAFSFDQMKQIIDSVLARLPS